MKDSSAFLDMRRYKNWAHKIGSWKISNYQTCPASFPPKYRVPHFCSPPWTPFRGCWILATARFNTCRGGWQASQVMLVVKEPACQCRRHKKLGFDPRVWKIPWRRAWQPTPVFLLGESHGQRNLVGIGLRRVRCDWSNLASSHRGGRHMPLASASL